ncbi:uncharacterized protein LKV04_001635 [Tautogolabrus adspersus]
MPSHIMLSYQWDDQALVKKIFDRLREDGLPVWMDIEGGVTGNINDAMAAGVEEAAVICPFMTPAYQASRSCKKELNYADSREVITAGLLWVDFRNLEKDERFEMCVSSLEEEIMYNAGHLLAVEEPRAEEVDQPEPSKPHLKRKPGRGFLHALSKLYIQDAGEQVVDPTGDTRNTVELNEKPGERCYWEEIKANGAKYYRNVVTNRYLGFDAVTNQVHSEASPSVSEEWLMLVDQTDQSHQRAVIIKNKHLGKFLAVQDGGFTGLTLYNEDCKWFLV